MVRRSVKPIDSYSLTAEVFAAAACRNGVSPRAPIPAATWRISRVARPWPRYAGSVHTALISVQPGGCSRSPAIATSAPSRRMPTYAPISTVAGRNGPGRVRSTRSSISGTSAGPSGTASGSSSPRSVVATSCTPGIASPPVHPSGSSATPATVKVLPGPISAARSAHARGSAVSATATNGDTSRR